MTKKTIRIISLMMAVVSLFCMLSLGAQAASTVGSVKWQGSSTGGSSKDVYVKTGSTAASKKVSVSDCGSGLGRSSLAMVFGSYELTIYKWNGSKWVQEQNYDLYNKRDSTITLKEKNTYYKIHIYAWKTQTIYNSYWNNNVKCSDLITRFKTKFSSKVTSGAYWIGGAPKLTLTPGKNCTMYNSCPV